MKTTVKALFGEPFAKWQPVTRAQMHTLEPGTSIAITCGPSTIYTVYRPPRRRGESPPQYFKRTRCCPDNFAHIHKGRFYCNPAHCSTSWKSRKTRDAHLNRAYAILD